ncbi:class III lanthionine synthetase LanKC [Microbacterium oleivorans]|uniref:Protein kinase domain-containing protein n=1 Tax=Microbacterium oleivorans TaxID=273677 RepID=A0A4R5YJE5_9MICO|nr:class III lanthionine synthetase LanKC [Microbacterium oleivorans]TDL45276.1 hypothetical protein E2R54_02085 [Microbacterium oleivorans]
MTGGGVDPTHPLYATADTRFYDHPGVESTSSRYDVGGARPWRGWAKVEQTPWVHFGRTDSALPDQGWKVHVSATIATASEVLLTTAEYCHDENLSFKFLAHEGHLRAALAKDADRASAGKFITIYPTDDDALYACLTDLDVSLRGHAGPYILSDLRWREGPLYVRYGAFTLQWTRHDGARVPAIRDLARNVLVPDIRGVRFAVPPWASTPHFVQRQITELSSPPPAWFPQITGALHHSNAGGVYTATKDEAPVVIKEARPHTGITPDGKDAVARLRHEVSVLQALPTTVSAPGILDTFTLHGHEFAVMERMPGRPLSEVVVARNPLGHSLAAEPALADYGRWALSLGARVRDAVASLHRAGWTHGDLHPGNVLVSEDDEVSLIDFEMARAVGSPITPPFGVPGFVTHATEDAVERDQFAAACIELHVLLPLIPLLHLDTTKAEDLPLAASVTFSLPTSWAKDLTQRLRRGLSPTHTIKVVTPSPTPDEQVAAITRTLLSDATPERDDRLWPGDPRQFREHPAGLAHGGLGVATALRYAGVALSSAAERWLQRVLLTSEDQPLGLMDGLAGTIWGSRYMGWDDAAEASLERLLHADTSAMTHDLYGGLAGVGLVLLSESDARPELLQHASDALHTLDGLWSTGVGPERVRQRGGGLLGGATGTAVLAMALHERTQDAQYLHTARRAIDYDVRSLHRAKDGTVHVNEGWRSLPYLGWGSAGIGLAMARYIAVDHREDYAGLIDGIISAAYAPFTAQAGLFQGRSGLMLFLSEVSRQGHSSDLTLRALAHHRDALSLHVLRESDNVRIAGDGLLRASGDLATGAAGVAIALKNATNSPPFGLLFPSPDDVAPQRKEVTHAIPALAANSRAR